MTLAICLSVLSLVASEDTVMPGDFLRVKSEAWTRWLDEDLNVHWHGIPFEDILAGEFGSAALVIDDPKALKTRVEFNAVGLTRRETLWHLAQRYHFTVRWAQKEEPRLFLGLLESEKREESVGGLLMTKVTHVMRSDYATYEAVKQSGKVQEEKRIGNTVYYSRHVDRDIGFDSGASAWFTVIERYKADIPPKRHQGDWAT